MVDETSYTATGPTGIGFRTRDGTQFEKGVAASGTTYGVHGIGLPAVGVGGPETRGVFGESEVGDGVVGQHSGMSGAFGVHGFSSSGAGVRGFGSPGVVGEGTTGVHGLGRGAREVEHVGVLGESDNRGAGVHGHNQGLREDNGHGCPGVRGSSANGYGGVFAGNFAQLRLEPAETVGPPRDPAHKAGEFFVDHRGALYYCYGGAPPRWQRLAGASLLTEFISEVLILVGIARP